MRIKIHINKPINIYTDIHIRMLIICIYMYYCAY